MDEGAVAAALALVPELAVLDADLTSYIASVIASQPTGSSAEDLAEAVGPFLESGGVADTEESCLIVCQQILDAIASSGGDAGTSKSGAAASAPVATTSSGGRGGGRRGRRAGRAKAAAAAATASVEPSDGGLVASSGAGGETVDDGEPVLLSKPVNISDRTAAAAKKDSKSGMLDFLWGRADNAFLKQNQIKDIVLTAKQQEKYAKRVARWKKRRAAMERKTKKGRRGYGGLDDGTSSAMAAGSAGGGAPVDFTPLTADEMATSAKNIDLPKIDVGFGGLPLIEAAELKIILGRKYGLIGQNGSGKTTLLRHLARRAIPGLPVGLTILHVQQEVRGGDLTVLDTVLASDVERETLMHEEEGLGKRIEARDGRIELLEAALAADEKPPAASPGLLQLLDMAKSWETSEAEARPMTAAEAAEAAEAAARDSSASAEAATASTSATASAEESKPVATASAPAAEETAEQELARLSADDEADTERVNEIYGRLDELDAASAEARAAEVLGGLGFTTVMQQLPTRALSGGWRMRVALACALFIRPDVLCLDEPTNHVDFPAIAWLEDYLAKYKRTCIIVSHDRHFLNHVATDIIHLTNRKLNYYRGNYDEFISTRAERERHTARAAASAEARRAHIQSFIDRFRANAKRATLVQSRIKALNRIEAVSIEATDAAWSFEFPEPEDIGAASVVVQVKDVGFGYDPTRLLFRGVNFGISLDARIGILGPNGVGKSTLIKIIMGELAPVEGAVMPHPKLKIAFFSQHHEDQLDLEMSPLELLVAQNPGTEETVARAHLGRFNLSAELALQRIGSLSGGQKSRVSFALMSFKAPHLLVMDEVTNHLDIETVDALITAIAMFQGGIVVVSHDQHFLEATCTEFWVLNSKRRMDRWRGTLASYRKVAESEKPVVQYTHPDTTE